MFPNIEPYCLQREMDCGYGDGTKLNFYYREETGKISTCNVYEVIDAYSECFLGYHISKTEDFEQQYMAYKKALRFSGHKPYEIRYDNQGGHKKLMSGDFFKKISHLQIATQPYNGNSKTIENVFKRFQESYLHREWFFTGQNITSKKIESKVNSEWVEANKSNLPTLEELERIYVQRRNEWNHSLHPKTNKSRISMYFSSENDNTHSIAPWEMIELFGIVTTRPITFRASGIELNVKGSIYPYDVLKEGMTDYDFRKKNTGKKFYIEYDLEDMSIVNLYEDTPSGRRFVGMAQKYIEIHRGKQEQNELDVKIIAERDYANKSMRIDNMEQIENIMEKHGLHPSQHGLKMPRLRANIGRTKIQNDTLGKQMKRESNADIITNNILQEIDIY